MLIVIQVIQVWNNMKKLWLFSFLFFFLVNHSLNSGLYLAYFSWCVFNVCQRACFVLKLIYVDSPVLIEFESLQHLPLSSSWSWVVYLWPLRITISGLLGVGRKDGIEYDVCVSVCVLRDLHVVRGREVAGRRLFVVWRRWNVSVFTVLICLREETRQVPTVRPLRSFTGFAMCLFWERWMKPCTLDDTAPA